MKKIISFLILATLLVFAFTSCFETGTGGGEQGGGEQGGGEQQPEQPTLEDAAASFDTLYANASTSSAVDFDVVAKITVEGVDFAVTWVSSESSVVITESATAGYYTVDVPAENAEALSYTLTATITDASGSTVTKTLNCEVPVILNAPVVGKAYTIAADNLDGTIYFAGTITEGRFDATTTEADAVPVYVQKTAVEGEYRIYFYDADGYKNYIIMDDKAAGAAVSTSILDGTIFVWNEECMTMVVADEDNGRAFGTSATNSYVNFSTYAVGGDYNWGKFLTKGDEVVPTPATPLQITIAEAIEYSKSLEDKGDASADKYTLRVLITSVDNTTYGNMHVTDGVDTIYIYGLYNAEGAKYGDWTTAKPVAGDYIIVTSAIGHYNDPQLSSATLVKHEPHVDPVVYDMSNGLLPYDDGKFEITWYVRNTDTTVIDAANGMAIAVGTTEGNAILDLIANNDLGKNTTVNYLINVGGGSLGYIVSDPRDTATENVNKVLQVLVRGAGEKSSYLNSHIDVTAQGIENGSTYEIVFDFMTDYVKAAGHNIFSLKMTDGTNTSTITNFKTVAANYLGATDANFPFKADAATEHEQFNPQSGVFEYAGAPIDTHKWYTFKLVLTEGYVVYYISYDGGETFEWLLTKRFALTEGMDTFVIEFNNSSSSAANATARLYFDDISVTSSHDTYEFYIPPVPQPEASYESEGFAAASMESADGFVIKNVVSNLNSLSGVKDDALTAAINSATNITTAARPEGYDYGTYLSLAADPADSANQVLYIQTTRLEGGGASAPTGITLDPTVVDAEGKYLVFDVDMYIQYTTGSQKSYYNILNTSFSDGTKTKDLVFAYQGSSVVETKEVDGETVNYYQLKSFGQIIPATTDEWCTMRLVYNLETNLVDLYCSMDGGETYILIAEKTTTGLTSCDKTLKISANAYQVTSRAYLDNMSYRQVGYARIALTDGNYVTYGTYTAPSTDAAE